MEHTFTCEDLGLSSSQARRVEPVQGHRREFL